MLLSAAKTVLTTQRLLLTAGEPSLADAVAELYQRNRAHFAPWDPPTPEVFFTAEAQAARIQEGLSAFSAGQGFRYWLLPRDAPTRVIGSVHFNQVARGAFHSCMLGYALDEARQGSGLMHEALQAGLAEMFSPRVNLHRVQAAVRPENKPSLSVLARLGFEVEGLSRDYLFIDGAWRDHFVHALRNPAFQRPSDWPPAPA
jgi:ribosomal-protein-alanine N-acetyltransferase